MPDLRNLPSHLACRCIISHSVRTEQKHWPRRIEDMQHSQNCQKVVDQLREVEDVLRKICDRVRLCHSNDPVITELRAKAEKILSS